MYHFLEVAISTSCSISLFCEVFADFFFETLVIFSAILLPIRAPVASAVFWIALFEAVATASVVDILSWMFLKRYDLLEKFLTDYQTVYLEQTYIILVSLVDSHY